MTRGTLWMAAIWLTSGAFALFSYLLGNFELPMAALIVLISFPLGVEIRSLIDR